MKSQHVLPATILDSGELRECHDCGAQLAGKQAHFDREGEAYCTICAEKPRRQCGELRPAINRPYPTHCFIRPRRRKLKGWMKAATR